MFAILLMHFECIYNFAVQKMEKKLGGHILSIFSILASEFLSGLGNVLPNPPKKFSSFPLVLLVFVLFLFFYFKLCDPWGQFGNSCQNSNCIYPLAHQFRYNQWKHLLTHVHICCTKTYVQHCWHWENGEVSRYLSAEDFKCIIL